MLYDPVAARLLALTRIAYTPVTGSVYRLWLFDNRAGPTTAPDGAKIVNATLRLLGDEVNPPVLARASEMISPACPVSVKRSVSPGTSIAPEPAHRTAKARHPDSESGTGIRG